MSHAAHSTLRSMAKARALHVGQRVVETCTSLRNLWRPENFHYHHLLHRKSNHFEGWYFKLVDAEERQPYAFMIGVFLGEDRHAFIQVLDGRTGRSVYHRFDVREFSAAHDRFDVRIGRNRFHAGGLSVELGRSDRTAEDAMRGEIKLGEWTRFPSSLLSPGAMGPYSFVPFIQCNHGLLSMDHALHGTLEVQGKPISYDRGRGYLEKDWGSSFPTGYTWAQCNHFDSPATAVTVAVATSPFLGMKLHGFVAGFLFRGQVHPFRAYMGSVIEHLQITDTEMQLRLRNRTHRLEVSVQKKSANAVLLAPYEGKMRERVAETMSSTMELRFSTLSGEQLFAGSGRRACLEIQGDLEQLTTPDVLEKILYPNLRTAQPAPQVELKAADRSAA